MRGLWIALATLLTATAAAATDWPVWGGSLAGTRHVALDQITPANVGQLQPAWVFHTGEDPLHKPDPRNLPAFEATPLKIGETLYLCTPRNQVIALDAETGAERWRFDPKTDTRGHYLVTCRGVSFADTPAAAECKRRIIAPTLDARLLALDADSGRPCTSFADQGAIHLTEGIGKVDPGTYAVTSAPLIAGGVIVTGALVLDNIAVDMPSGVVRAYDAVSGTLLWAWDAGRADGETGYDRGSPNAWSSFSADETLGLVFLPTGNRSPDYFGGHRTAAEERYNSSVVALDLKTGAVRWSFQTVHHDIWDYDIPAQPVLADFPKDGALVPAVIQPTKQGQIFVLDRRTGEPLTRVEERAVPQGAVAGERTSPTQPFSVEMPSFGPPRITDADLWGLTPFDRAWCRRELGKYRNEGIFTPPSPQGTLVFPNNMGAMSWGSVAVDPDRQVMIVNSSRVGSIVRLLTRAEADAREAKGETLYQPQRGTPYAALIDVFMSPLGIPCTAPPWGRLTAVDLKTRQILWDKPLGTVRDHAPLPLPWELGMPNSGGALLTGSGLVFIGASADAYLRAFDIKTGEKLWQDRLPGGGQATPMSYLSEKSGRQFVVIAAGGHTHLGTKLSDAVVAYALPARR